VSEASRPADSIPVLAGNNGAPAGLPLRYLYLAMLIAVIMAAGQVLELIFRAAGGSLSIYSKTGLGLPLLYLLALVLVGLFMKVAAPRSLGRLLGLYWANKRRAGYGFVVGFGFGTATVVVLYILLAIVGDLALTNRARYGLDLAYAGTFVLGILGACLVAITEETIFRGFLMSYLRWSDSRAVTIGAVLVSALVFATMHNIKNPLEWLTAEQLPLFVGLFLLGTLLAVTYIVTGSILCSIGIHAGLVAFGEVFLRQWIIKIDFSPWWLGGFPDLRQAPLVWFAFAGATLGLITWRKRLNPVFAIERPFVGAALSNVASKVSTEQE
jgi:membrane protease YdiL (CAAX protease family)